jgi:hypothetical protein
MSELPHSRAWIPPRRKMPGRPAWLPLAILMALQLRPSHVLFGSGMRCVKGAFGPAAAVAREISMSATLK